MHACMYVGKRLEVPRTAMQVRCLSFWNVFYSFLCSFHKLITYGISSTCGQHTWDMLFADWRFFISSRSSFFVVFAETSGIAFWWKYYVFFDNTKMAESARKPWAKCIWCFFLRIHNAVLKHFQHFQPNNIFNVSKPST